MPHLSGFCAWEVFCSSLVTVPRLLFVCPYVGSSVYRFLCLGGSLFPTCANFYLAFSNHIVLLFATTLWPTSHTMPIGSASLLTVDGLAPHSDRSVQSTHLATNDNDNLAKAGINSIQHWHLGYERSSSRMDLSYLKQ